MNAIQKNYFYNLVFILSNLLFPIVTFPYASRVLGPEGIGKVQFVSTFAQYFVLLAVLGVPIYGIREVAKCRNNIPQLKKLFTELITLNVVSSAILVIFYAFIIYLVPSMRADWHFYAVAVLLLIFSFCNIDWFFSGLERFRFIAIRSLIIKLIAIATLFLFVKDKSDAINYLWILIGAVLFTNIWNISSAWSYISLKLLSKSEIKKHLSPLLYIFSTSAAISIYAVSDILILGFFKDYIEVGYYTAATKINKVTIPVLTVIGTVLIPKISQAFKEQNIEEVKKLAKLSLDYVLILGIPMVIGLIGLAPEIMIIFSGKEFTPAILTMQIFAPVVVIIGLSNVWAIQILTPAGKDKEVTFAVTIGLILSIILNVLLIPRFSYLGAAISNLLSELVVMLAFTYFTYRFIKIDFDLKITIQSLLLSLCFLPIIHLVRTNFPGQDLVICLISLISCTILFVLFQFIVFKNISYEGIHRYRQL